MNKYFVKIERRFFILLILFIIVVLLTFWPILLRLVKKWMESEDYTHSFIVLPVIGYMVLNRISRVDFSKENGNGLGLSILIISLLIYILSLKAKIDYVSAVMMVSSVCGALGYIYGFNSLKPFITPILLILLIIPIPTALYSTITHPLQIRVSQVSEYLIRSAGIPIYREGNILTIPGKSFQVVQACSGMRSIVSLFTLSVILAYFSLKKVCPRVFLSAMSIPVAVGINIVRVTIMIILYNFYNLDLSEGTTHTIEGVVAFLAGLAVLFLFEKVFEHWESAK